MNRIKVLTLAMLAAAVVFTSCKKDEDDPFVTPPSGPTLTLNPESVTGWIGDLVNIDYTIATSSANEIVSIDISTNETQIADMFLSGDELDDNYVDSTFTFIMPAGETGNEWEDGQFFTVTFIATHEVEGTQYTTTKTVEVTYDSPETPLTEEHDGVLFHILGTGQGAWDLVNNAGVSSGGADADKDMIHVTDGEADTFNPVWETGAGNETMYVLADAFDYDNATMEATAAAYAAGTPSSTVTFAEGEVYVAMLRGVDGDYAVIKVGAITMVEFSNEDNMMFTYKK